jgi:glycosyltransferase involved in cell wall biosynthesis
VRKPVRVAHLTPAYFSADSVVGGGERYVYNLAQSLRVAPEFQQCVFAIGAEDKRFEHNGIPVRVLRNESPLPQSMDAFSAALWQELQGFDLVHVHQCLTVFGAYSVAIVRSLGIPAVGTDLGGGENELMLGKRCINLFDGLISISRYAHDLIARFFTGPHEVLIGPVDTSHFVPRPGVTRDPATVLCVSRILPHKGIDQVIEALPPRLRLVVVGRIYHKPYHLLLRHLASGKNVQFVHDADDDMLVNLYQTSGLFVQASVPRDIYGNTITKSELMGLTTLEAMACGLAAAVADTGSLPELVPDRRFGRVFAGVSELSAIFQDVQSEVWPPRNAGVLAREHVVEAHGVEIVGQRLAAFYHSTLARRGRLD